MKKKFQAVLKSVSQDTRKCDNAKQTQYRVCVIELANGKDVFAKMWEKSFSYGVTLGNTYTCELEVDGKDVWLTVLNGAQATIATTEDFADLIAELAV